MIKKYIFILLIICIGILIYKIRIGNKEKYNNKQTLKLKFGTKFFLGETNKERHHFQSEKQFIDYFLTNYYNYIVVNDNEKSDITVWDIYLADNSKLRDDEINILICVENIPHWNLDIYKHYKNYGEYNDNKMKIYLYNHINKLVKTDKYISIPLIYNYINYYIYNNSILQPSIYTNFQDKKFCLMINKSNLNTEINNITEKLKLIGNIDNISQYSEIINKSCYHSVELLNIFNKYKFIICFENSYADGYITEKIFNCFFARTIPIYKGSDKINEYINKKSFIDARDDNFINTVKNINDDENLYNRYINSSKISKNYNDENYENELVNFINNYLTL